MAGGLLTTSPWQRGRGQAGGESPQPVCPGRGRLRFSRRCRPPGHGSSAQPVRAGACPSSGMSPLHECHWWQTWGDISARLGPTGGLSGPALPLARGRRVPLPRDRWPFGKALAGPGQPWQQETAESWPVTLPCCFFPAFCHRFPPVLFPCPTGMFCYWSGVARAGEGWSFWG